VQAAAELLNQASKVTILFGRMSRSEEDWNLRVKFAEKLQAQVVTDLKNAACFPTDHPQHTSAPGYFMSPQALQAIKDAEVLVLFDWVDPGGALKQAFGQSVADVKVIHVSLDMHIHRGWSTDMGSLQPSDVFLLCEPDDAVKALLLHVAPKQQQVWEAKKSLPAFAQDDVVSLRAVADVLRELKQEHDFCFARLPLGWNGTYLHWKHPMDYLGADGGGGIGAGPGNAVGVGLALQEMGSKRIPIALIGDGDFLMSNTAVWTAVKYQIPILIVVCNNHSFFNDELHQERVAKERGRPVENKWIGQRMSEPEIDIAQLSSSMGAQSIGPVRSKSQLKAAFDDALKILAQGLPCIMDLDVAPGYDANMSGQSAENSAAHKR
jgi:thiamine pyrophosphate-dependent acetolactate synthase large subunit-like protein